MNDLKATTTKLCYFFQEIRQWIKNHTAKFLRVSKSSMKSIQENQNIKGTPSEPLEGIQKSNELENKTSNNFSNKWRLTETIRDYQSFNLISMLGKNEELS